METSAVYLIHCSVKPVLGWWVGIDSIGVGEWVWPGSQKLCVSAQRMKPAVALCGI